MTAVLIFAATGVLVVAARVLVGCWQHHIETDMNRWTNTKGRG